MIADFNLENWPIVYLKLNNNEINKESFEEYKKYYLGLLIRCKNNNEKMVLICNLNTTRIMPPEYIMKQSYFNREIYKFNKDYVKTVCILCNDKNLKNILNLYFSVNKPAAPYKLCISFDKINKYLNQNFKINFDSNILEELNMSILSNQPNQPIQSNEFNNNISEI